MTLTAAQDAIETADSYLSNAVLPTYTELLHALQDVQRAVAPEVTGAFRQPTHQAIWGGVTVLLARHGKTMRGDFGA